MNETYLRGHAILEEVGGEFADLVRDQGWAVAWDDEVFAGRRCDNLVIELGDDAQFAVSASGADDAVERAMPYLRKLAERVVA